MIIKYAIIIAVIITFLLISLFFCSDIKQSTNKYRKKIGYGKYRKSFEKRKKEEANRVLNVKAYEFSDTNKMRKNVKRTSSLNKKTSKSADNKSKKSTRNIKVKKSADKNKSKKVVEKNKIKKIRNKRNKRK